ncbi:hypothetical protein ACIQD3_11475 [Peribacillus loiseleuriae]|uniref:hypothetical protein n=1 Tax=Peribacillus loiseleuriae TaxID=1679170 RepID=UPI0038275474
MGRVLDYLYKADAWKVYSTLSLKTLKKLELPIRVLHKMPPRFPYMVSIIRRMSSISPMGIVVALK